MLTGTHSRTVSLRASEWICLAYFGWITVLSFLVGAPARRVWQLLVLNIAVGMGILFLRVSPTALRDWIPVPLLLVGYYEAGRLTFPRADRFYERAFLRWGRRLFGSRSANETAGWLQGMLEFFYLQCYSIVPMGIGLLYVTQKGALADYYWSNVLGAAFIAYGLTPLFPALPPRRLPGDSAVTPKRTALRKFSLWISDHGSIEVNSFPSGHAAAAAAATLALLRILPVAGICYMIVTAGILWGSVRGKYHYAVDALAGVAVAVGVCVALWRM